MIKRINLFPTHTHKANTSSDKEEIFMNRQPNHPRKARRKKLAATLAAAILALSLTPTPYATLAAALTDRDVAVATLERAQLITLSGTTATTAAAGVTVAEGKVTITQAGTYALTGLFQGQVAIELAEKGEVNILLNGVTIDAATGAALSSNGASKTVVTLADDTQNVLTSGGEDTAEEETAALFSQDDLTINGTGALQVTSGKDGITSKDSLILVSGDYTINAADDGIVGKDEAIVAGGNVTIVAGGDGIKATNTEDTTKGNLIVQGGSLTITTGGGAGAAMAEDASAKALNAAGDVTVTDGILTLNAADDGVNATRNLLISGGSLTIAAGDDGIHSDADLTISGGEINITQSDEGVEGVEMNLTGGVIYVVSSDDGINAAGGEVTASTGSGGRGGMQSTSSGNLTISGGLVVVNAQGDGIDVNGNLQMSGGEVYVAGPTQQDNGALDYDGTFTLTGGTLVALDSGGMSVGPTSTTLGGGMYRISGDATLNVVGQDGQVISFSPNKTYAMAVVYSDKLTQGATYTLESDAGSTTITASSQESSMQGGLPWQGGHSGMTSGGQGRQPGGRFGGQQPGRNLRPSDAQGQGRDSSPQTDPMADAPAAPDGNGTMPQQGDSTQGQRLPEGKQPGCPAPGGQQWAPNQDAQSAATRQQPPRRNRQPQQTNDAATTTVVPATGSNAI